jgi:hypothetical protein
MTKKYCKDNTVFVAIYEDAVFSDINIDRDKLREEGGRPRLSVSVGTSVEITDVSVSLTLVTAMTHPQRSVRGVVIPRRALVTLVEISNQESSEEPGTRERLLLSREQSKRDLPVFDLPFGKRVSIYWDDVRVFRPDDQDRTSVPCMLTEGSVLFVSQTHLFLASPETLDLRTLRNHPEKQPAIYVIPVALINEVIDTPPGSPEET